MRSAPVIAAAIVLCACSAPARPARPPGPPADPLAWLPADAIAVARAAAGGAPLLAFVAKSPRRPACVDAALAGVRESFQLQRSPAERQVLVAIGALDRGRLEACGVEVARALLGLVPAVRRDGALTRFELPDGGGQVAGFAGDRVVLADTAEQVRWALAPPRTIGPADPLGPLLPRLLGADLAAVTSLDYLARWTQLPARGLVLRLAQRPVLRADTRVIYADADAARRALAALTGAAARDDASPALRRVLALVAPAAAGPELAFDLAPLFAPEHAALLEELSRELAALPR